MKLKRKNARKLIEGAEPPASGRRIRKSRRHLQNLLSINRNQSARIIQVNISSFEL